MYRINQLLDRMEEKKVNRRLDYIYSQIPAITCKGCASCCFNSPETFFIEFLNIFQYLKTLPLSLQKETVRKLVLYEFYNLVTLDCLCPFLESDKCVIYPSRSLQCYLFPLYPEKEYQRSQLECRQQNKQLAITYKESFGINLPEETLTYDVDQCGNNIDYNGRTIIVSRMERERLHQQVMSVESDIISFRPVDKVGTKNSFSHYFCLVYSSENKIQTEKIKAIKEYQKNRNTNFVERIVKEYQTNYLSMI